MYRFALRPRWVLLHVFVVALIVVMINLMFWQIQRLHEKQSINRAVAERSTRAPVTLDEAVKLVAAKGAEAVKYQRVLVQGTYDPEGEVTIASRSFEGAPGRWVATPLQVSGERSVLVVRGWINEATYEEQRPIRGVLPPTGEVKVVGYVQPTQIRTGPGVADRASGRLSELLRVDVDRFTQQYPGTVAGFYLQLSEQQPATDSDRITPIPLPEPDEGPHRSYAGQWLIFSVIAAVGYPLALRRVAQQRQVEFQASPSDTP